MTPVALIGRLSRTVSAPANPQPFVSPDGAYRLTTEWDYNDRGGAASLMILQLTSGETLLRVWYGQWQGAPVFRGSVVEADFLYYDQRWRARIDVAARTFVFHPNETERPLSEMDAEIRAVFAQQRGAVATGPRKWRRRLGSLCLIALNLAFVAAAAWVLVFKPPPVRPKDPWMAAGCILLFGGCAVLEMRSLLKNW